MIILLASAKTFNTIQEKELMPYNPLIFDEKTKSLISQLQSYDGEGLGKLMKISSALGKENEKRYKNFNKHQTKGYKAMDYLNGEVYKGLNARTLNQTSREYLEKHLYILSGLYGCVRGGDIIKPYRLEMGQKFQAKKIEDLYHFWQEDLTQYILNQLQKHEEEQVLINLASTEYVKAIKLKEIAKTYPVITVSFKEEKKDGTYKVVAMYAKKARGKMVRYIAEKQLKTKEDLKLYQEDGYKFNEKLSTEEHYVFVRCSCGS